MKALASSAPARRARARAGARRAAGARRGAGVRPVTARAVAEGRPPPAGAPPPAAPSSSSSGGLRGGLGAVGAVRPEWLYDSLATYEAQPL